MKVVLTQKKRRRLKKYYDLVEDILNKEVKQQTIPHQEYLKYFYTRFLLIRISHDGYDDIEVDFNLGVKVVDVLSDLDILYQQHLKKND